MRKSRVRARARQATHRQVGEISTEDTRDVMRRIVLPFPIERLAILESCPVDNRAGRGEKGNTNSGRSLEDRLELAHALVRPVDAECTFYFGRYAAAAAGHTRRVRHPPADPKENCFDSPFSFKNKPLYVSDGHR